MTAKPRKPLLVNLTWAGAALFGLVVMYVGAWAATGWAASRGVISGPTLEMLDGTVFLPFGWYMRSDLPGADWLYECCGKVDLP